MSDIESNSLETNNPKSWFKIILVAMLFIDIGLIIGLSSLMFIVDYDKYFPGTLVTLCILPFILVTTMFTN